MIPHPCALRRLTLIFSFLCLFMLPSFAGPPVAIRAIGEVKQQDGLWQIGPKPATLVIGEPDLRQCRLRFQLQITDAPRSITEMVFMPADPANLKLNAVARYSFRRDAEGRVLSIAAVDFNKEKNAWGGTHGLTSLTFWPSEKDTMRLADAVASGQQPQSWRGRWLNLCIEAGESNINLWCEGRMLIRFDRPAEVKGPLALLLAAGDQVRNFTQEPLTASRFLTVDIDPYANFHAAKPLTATEQAVDGIPFTFARDRQGMLDLRDVQWPEWKQDPVSYYENYDAGAPFLDDMRMPMLRVPSADYSAVHLLAVADPDPEKTATITLRAGSYGQRGQTVQHDFTAVVPRANVGTPQLTTPDGPLYHVRVPMPTAFAQDIKDGIDVEITKEIRLAVCQDDAVRFRTRPLGLPSGVRIAAITFEKSPLQMTVSSAVAAHAFEEPQRPAFTVQLTNITETAQEYRLTVAATHLNGTSLQVRRNGSVKAGEAADVQTELPVKLRGYYDLTISLTDGKGNALLQRKTSFAVLPPNTRKHRDTSPFGTWDFYGAHFTPSDPEKLGPLYAKLGLRYGMFNATTEVMQKYGVIYGGEPVVLGEKGIDTYAKSLARLPGFTPPGLLFHEHTISLPHMVRVPDLFTDRQPYKLNADEEKRFNDHWTAAIAGAKAMREKYPTAHLRLGNGSLPFKEEFLRHHFPPELFDSLGNEIIQLHAFAGDPAAGLGSQQRQSLDGPPTAGCLWLQGQTRYPVL